jgi:hypothetical protein
LIVGSPNATSRAWGTQTSSGRNTEAFARLSISAEVAKGLFKLLGGATTVTPEDLDVEPPETDAERDALDAARQQVAASWAVVQSVRQPDQRRLSPAPVWKNTHIRMSVGFAAGDLADWPYGQSEIALPAPSRTVHISADLPYRRAPGTRPKALCGGHQTDESFVRAKERPC